MTGISQAGAYLSVIKLLEKSYASANTKSHTAKDTIIDKIRQTDPKNADALEKQLSDSKEVVAQLRNSKVYGAQSKKAAAAEKLKRIKAEMQMLKTMGGDPRIVAKQIARLAKELAAAAREYVSAGGTISPDQTASADTATSASGNNVAALNTVASRATDSGAVSASVAATAGSGEKSVPGEKDAESDDATKEQDSASTTTTGAALAEGARQYQETQQQKFKDDLQEQGAKIMKKTLEAVADREFANDVSIVAARLKALAKMVKQRLQKAGDHKADQDIKQTDQALAEVEKSVADITGRIQGVMANSYA